MNHNNKFLIGMFAAVLLAGVLSGCGSSRQTKGNAEDYTSGILTSGYFYQDGGITVSTYDRFLYSDWEPVEFDYICTDLTCSHLSESCSALTLRDKNIMSVDFAVRYRDCLVLLHTYAEEVMYESNKLIFDIGFAWHTDVYEADLDGGNRKKVSSFDGGIASSTMTYAAVMQDGMLYFGGPLTDRVRMKLSEDGVSTECTVQYSDAVFCLNLNDYTVERFAETQDRTSEAYNYQIRGFDGYIYAIVSDFTADTATWYRIDTAARRCEEIRRFDMQTPWFIGAAGNTVYYTYFNQTLHAWEVGASEERELITAEGGNDTVTAFVGDAQIYVLTDCSYEEGHDMSEYTVLDTEGNVLGTYFYDDYITFAAVLGDRIIFDKPFSEMQEWWVYRNDVEELLTKGVYIGDYYAQSNDKLFENN